MIDETGTIEDMLEKGWTPISEINKPLRHYIYPGRKFTAPIRKENGDHEYWESEFPVELITNELIITRYSPLKHIEWYPDLAKYTLDENEYVVYIRPLKAPVQMTAVSIGALDVTRGYVEGDISCKVVEKILKYLDEVHNRRSMKILDCQILCFLYSILECRLSLYGLLPPYHSYVLNVGFLTL